MKNNFKSRSIIRSITRLFTPKVTTNAHKLYPIAYYRRVYLSKPMFEGVELVAKIERKSKIRMTNELMERGSSSYMGEKLTEYIEDERAAREFHQRLKINRFVRVLRHYARERGMDISKLL